MSEQNKSNYFANSFFSSLGKQLGDSLGFAWKWLIPIAVCVSVLLLFPEITNTANETMAILGGCAIASVLTAVISTPYAIIIGVLFWVIMGNLSSI